MSARLVGRCVRVALLVTLVVVAIVVNGVGRSSATSSGQDDFVASYLNAPGTKRAIAEGQRLEQSERAFRASPKGVADRARSRSAFRHQDRKGALGTARDRFGAVVAAKPPGEMGPQTQRQVVGYLGNFGAIVRDANGRRGVATSDLPLRTEEGEGPPQSIDLDLDKTAGGFEPRAPLVATSYPGTADSALRLPDADIGVRIEGLSKSEGDVVDGKVFYANVAQDTDLLVSPTATGLETFMQLRSPASPTDQTMVFDLPSGASLTGVDAAGKETSERNELAGVIVVKDGKHLVDLQPPSATDAQGRELVTHYSLIGSDRVKVEVDLPSDGDVAYPLMVDPVLNGYGTVSARYGASANFDGWVFESNKPAAFTAAKTTTLLKTTTRMAGAPRLNDFGAWVFHAPSGVYIYQAEFDGLTHSPNQSWHVAGIYDDVRGGWEPGGMYNENGARMASSGGLVIEGASAFENYWGSKPLRNACARVGCYAGPTAGLHPGQNKVVWSLHHYGTPTAPPYVSMQGAIVMESEDAPPVFDPVTHSPALSGWVSQGTFTSTLHIRDAGLGFSSVAVAGAGTGATGTTNSATCNGRRQSPCPATFSDPVTYSAAGLPEGVNTISAQAKDIVANQSAVGAPNSSWQVKVDRSAPALTLGGTLKAHESETLTDGQYQLAADAVDGSAASPSGQRSGVKAIDIKVDGNAVKSETQPCAAPEGSCSLSTSATIDTADYATGAHTVTVTAKDQLDQTTIKTLTFRVDRLAPDATVSVAPGGWQREDSTPNATVSGDDHGGSGIRRFELRYPDGSPATPVERVCDAAPATPACQTPDSAQFPLSIGGAHFPGEGRTTISGRATDARGNQSGWADTDVLVDRSAPALQLSGSLYATHGLLPGDSYELDYDAQDGSSATRAQERSGVKNVSIAVRNDGGQDSDFHTKFSTTDQSCPAGSCPLSGAWTANRADFDANTPYTVRVTATDEVGHAEVRYVSMFFADPLPGVLPDIDNRLGLEDWWHYDTTPTGDGTSARVNLATGNLIWQATPVNNPGRGLSTIANLTYNSQETQAEALLPESPVGDLLGQYDEVGRGFSLNISGVTRVNEPLDFSGLVDGKVALVDGDGTRHVFQGADGALSQTFASPAGVQLTLRRFSGGLLGGGGLLGLGGNAKAWAMTSPDGVTHFFDEQGYETSILDRNDNAITFNYDYRGATRDVCDFLATAGLAAPSDLICVRKLISVQDATGRLLTLSYGSRKVKDIAPGLIPDSGLPGALLGQLTEPAAYASGPVASMTDHAGRVHNLTYDDAGYLTQMDDAVGAADQRSWKFGYEAPPSHGATDLGLDQVRRRQMVSVTDPRNHATTFAYRSDGQSTDQGQLGDNLLWRRRVRALVDRGEQGTSTVSRTFAYSHVGSDAATERDVATVTDARGNDWVHKMDDTGRPRELTDPNLTETRISWDHQEDGAVPAGYVADNNPTQIIEAAGSSDEASTKMDYNANGQLTSNVDPKGHETQLTYRASAGVAATMAPTDTAGIVTDLASITTPRGVETSGDPDDNKTSFGYPDDRGNPTSTTDGEGNVAHTVFDAHGQVTDETSEVGDHTVYSDFDPNGQPRTVTDPRGKVSKYTYDAVGNSLTKADPRSQGALAGNCSPGRDKYTTYIAYDSYDRPKSTVSPKLGCAFITRSTEYDANGNSVATVDGEGKRWETSYSANDQQVERRSPSFAHAGATADSDVTAGEITTRTYDVEDNVTSEVAPKGNASGATPGSYTTRYVNDPIGRVLAKIRQSRGGGDPDKDLATSYAYDRRDNVVGMVDPKGNAGGGQPAENPADLAKRRMTYVYDKANNQTDEIEDPSDLALHTHRCFDANDNLVAETKPRGMDGSPGDACATDFTTHYAFDGRDLTTSVTTPKGSTGVPRKTTYAYRADGKVSSIVDPKGNVSDTAGDHEMDLAYYETGELKSRTLPWDSAQNGSHDLKVQYTIDDVGRPITVRDGRGLDIHNTFLDSGELASTSRPSWWKLSGGQVQERGAKELGSDASVSEARPQNGGQGDFAAVNRADAPDALPRAGDTTFAYDDNLRLTGVTDVAGNTATMGYDPVGRLRQTSHVIDSQAAGGPLTMDQARKYDLNGNAVYGIDAQQNATKTAFDQFDRQTTEVRPGSPDPETSTTAYDPNGTVYKATTPAGRVTTNGYDEVDRLTSTQDGEQHTTTFGYDSDGNRVAKFRPLAEGKTGTARNQFRTTYDFDSADEMSAKTNGDNEVWNYEYDANGNQTKSDAPAPDAAPHADGDPVVPTRDITTQGYDGLDRRIFKTTGGDDASGDKFRTHLWEYDPNGLLHRTVDPTGVHYAGIEPGEDPKANFAYSDDESVNSDAAAENATVYEYPRDTDPTLPSKQRLPWNSDDSSDQHYKQDMTWYARGWLKTLDPPNTLTPNVSARTTYDYFDSGWIKSAQDSHKTIKWDYDTRGDEKSWTAGGNRKVTRSYYPSGMLHTRVGHQGADPANEDRYSYSYDYTPDRQLARTTDNEKQRTTSYVYDGAGRQVRVDEKAWNTGESAHRGKDTKFGYDADDNVTDRWTDGAFNSDTPNPSDYTGGKHTAFGYDNLDRETSAAVADSDGPDRRTTSDWWAGGQLKQRVTMRGTSGVPTDTADNDTIERRFYFSDGRLSRMDRKRRVASGFSKEQNYGYGVRGNRTQDERGMHDFNARDQLTSTDKGSNHVDYERNGLGAVQHKTQTKPVDGNTVTYKSDYHYKGDEEELTSIDVSATSPGLESTSATTTYDYNDALGQVKSYTFAPSVGDKEKTQFSFDEFGRQTSTHTEHEDASDPDADPTDQKDMSFDFDALDRRDTKTEGDRTSDLSYVGSSEALSQEQQVEGGSGERERFDYDSQGVALGMQRTHSATEQPGRYRAFDKDANGSVEGLEDDVGDSPADDKYSYDDDGETPSADPTMAMAGSGPSGASDDAAANPFRFEGHYRDDSSDTYDVQARPYQPSAGRFLTEDRFEQASGDLALEASPLTGDRYGFAGGNPVDTVEFDGHDPHALDTADRGSFDGRGASVAQERQAGHDTGGAEQAAGGEAEPGQSAEATASPSAAAGTSDAGSQAETPAEITSGQRGSTAQQQAPIAGGRPTLQPKGLNPEVEKGNRPHPKSQCSGAEYCQTADVTDGEALASGGRFVDFLDKFSTVATALPTGGESLVGESLVRGAAKYGDDAARLGKDATKGAEEVGAYSPLVPRGATGPFPTRAPGYQYIGGRGGSGLHPNVTGVRFMEETSHHAARRVYMNAEGQTAHPFTGRTIAPDHPMAHLEP